MTDEFDTEPMLISDAIAELVGEWEEALAAREQREWERRESHRLLFDAGFPEPT